MKILHFWRTDFLNGGGGAIAMYRLHEALRLRGVDSKILSHIKTVDTPYSIKRDRSKYISFFESKLRRITSFCGFNDLHAISSFGLKNHYAYKEADILHFHGIHGNFFSYLALPFLTAGKRVVFTLHDMWAFTGHCAYSYDCGRWATGCGQCPYMTNYPPIKRDSTKWEWKLKKKIYNHSNLAIIALSSNQTEQVQKSILQHFPVFQIGNSVDLDIFKPYDPVDSRNLFNIPQTKKVLLFAARRLNNYNKGGELLLEALRGLPDSIKKELVLVTIGDGGEDFGHKTNIECINFGYIIDDKKKALIYSAADLFVSPTRAESFGLVLLESLACGTPVVAFGVGGVSDLVLHYETGYLAESENPKDLRKGIIEFLRSESLLARSGDNGRQHAINKYSNDIVVNKHIALYDCLLREGVPGKSRIWGSPDKGWMERVSKCQIQ